MVVHVIRTGRQVAIVPIWFPHSPLDDIRTLSVFGTSVFIVSLSEAAILLLAPLNAVVRTRSDDKFWATTAAMQTATKRSEAAHFRSEDK